MSFYKRTDFNHEIIEECLELLKSPSDHEQCKAIVLSAYIIEQAFKITLSKINPLLCLDKRQITPQKEVLFSLKRLTPEQSADIKTIAASDSLEKVCAVDATLCTHKNTIAEIFRLRNYILHSHDDIYFDPESAVGQAITSLRVCKTHICKSLKLARSEFHPISTTEFQKIEHDGLLKELKKIRKSIATHKKLHSQMTTAAIQERLPPLHGNFKEIFECPACGEEALQEIIDVDYDWNPDGVLTSAITYYECTVCDLHLSSREEDLIESYCDFINSRRATLMPRKNKQKDPI